MFGIDQANQDYRPQKTGRPFICACTLICGIHARIITDHGYLGKEKTERQKAAREPGIGL
jgi:hypothetical protein